MARTKTNKTRAIADINMFKSKQMQNDLINNGWSVVNLIRDNSAKLVTEPFMIFRRSISLLNFGFNWIFSAKNPNSQNNQNLQTLINQASSASNSTGASSTMGVAKGCLCPQGQTAPANNAISTLGDIATIQNMRMNLPSFCLGFDTEYYYDSSGTRHILSWQFTFIQPDRPAELQEILVFACNENKLLPFSYILNYIIENFGIYKALGRDNSDNKGFSYFRTHRWRVPVKKKNGLIRPKDFTSFDEAVKACCNPAIAKALQNIGKWKKADIEIVETPSGIEQHYSYEIDGYPIGYLNVYTEADKHAVPVTLVCHTGSADISTLNFENRYEKDMMLRLSQIQGGLMTLKPYYMHNPVLTRHKYFYPVQLTVRDTMGFAPSKMKRLEDLGQTINVPKLVVQKPYTKDDMLSYMMGDTIGFSEYAINDAVIALLYSAELWGANSMMPITVSSASGRAAVPVIKSYFGIDKDDDDTFNLKYRGLKRVSKGLIPNPKNFGFLENTSLEPLDFDCEMLQTFAKNAYKGGYNGCFSIGYYDFNTNDFDLENAYPTCMSLVPDVDWEHCIAMEYKNTKLTPMMVRTPFDPVFAFIDFKFPDNVQYPCIPVTVDGSMIYPRSNEGYESVYASAPELYLALKLGAEITVKRIIIGNVLFDENGVPSHSLFEVVRSFVNDRNLAKQTFSKGSLADLLLKEGANSIYGKTAQDVIDKTSWSAYAETMVNIGASQITSPYHACLTTAGVRCVLLSAMNQLSDLGYQVYSVTTDGFITNADLNTLEHLDLYGFTKLFQTARMMLVNDPTMWAIKHKQDDLVNLTTRGNASLIVGDKDLGILPGVMAHNSFVTGFDADSYKDRYSFITQVLSRTGRLRTVTKSFVRFKDLAKRNNRLDFSVHAQERMLSMDFDMKRKPVESSLVNKILDIDGVTYDIGNIDTEPYDTISEYKFYKNTSRNMKVLRSYKDWVLFFDKIKMHSDGKHRIITDKEWSILFSAVMAYRLRVPLDAFNGEPANIPFLDDAEKSVAEKVEWINKYNHSSKVFTVNTWKDCRKQTRISQMLPEALFIDKVKEMIDNIACEDDYWVHEIDYTSAEYLGSPNFDD